MKVKWTPPEPLLVSSVKGHQQLHPLLPRLLSLIPALHPRFVLGKKNKCNRGHSFLVLYNPLPSQQGVVVFLQAEAPFFSPHNVPATVRITNVFLVWVSVVAPMLLLLVGVLLRPKCRKVMPCSCPSVAGWLS